jgi:predicted nucleotidyltransferase
MSAAISVPREALASLCRRHGIRRLSLFGSVLRDDFRADSDVDVLVEFDSGARVGYIGLAGIELELAELLGRKVDLNTPGGLPQRFRSRVLEQAEVLYAG